MITRLEASPDHVMADPSQVHQIVMNLVVNARDAMSIGGRLVIATRNEEVLAGTPDRPPGHYVVLSVADTGTGMDQETMSHIFEPFFTTKERGKGTGLGLSTVYGLVQQSGGAIRLDSAVGTGTTFHIYLPQVSGGVIAATSAPIKPAHVQGSETVLVAEDQPVVRELAVETLRGLGYRVLAASDGVEAFRIATEHTGPIHILLTDVVMPGMDGWMLAERVSALRPGLKVIYTSGYTDDVVGARRVIEAGAAYLPKPFTPAVLTAKIHEVAAPAEVPEAPATLKRTVLVVDDDESVRNLFPSLLGNSYRVLLAAGGKEALDIVRRESRIDLVLTDLFMPDQDGIETIQALQDVRPALRIIAMSGAFDGQFLTAADRCGVDATLRKPIELETLRQTVDEVLNRALRPA
jgi:hypothetical protein